MTTTQTPAFELVSHHLCPFLHRAVILLERKGLKQGQDFTVTRVPIYDLPPRLFDLSRKGRMPVLVMADNRVLVDSNAVTISAYFDETLAPGFFPADAFERAVHRSLILAGGDLLTTMRMVYTAKDEAAMNKALGQLFAGLHEVEPTLRPLMGQTEDSKNQMVESVYAPLFTLMLTFDRIKDDPRWTELPEIRQYADRLVADPVVVATKSPDYLGEFDRFFNYFGSTFKLVA